MVTPITVPPLFKVATAADDVQCDAAFGELVQSGRLAGEERGEYETRSMGDEVSQGLGLGRGISGNGETLGRGR